MPDIALDALESFALAGDDRLTGPKYERLFAAFAAAIRSGQFQPGQRVPAETELAARLPVSLGTVQRALAKLASSGFVVRRRKAGTFIAERRTQVNEVFVYRFQDPDSGEIMLPYVRALRVGIDAGDAPWHRALGAPRLVRLDRLVWFDRDPPAYSSVFFSLEHGRVFLDMALEQLHTSSSHRVLIEHYNLPTLRMEHRLSCRTLSTEACEHLRLPASTTGIVWDIKDYSFHDEPSLYHRFQLPPGHRPVEITERIGGVPPDDYKTPSKERPR